jgi:hypothetical protein
VYNHKLEGVNITVLLLFVSHNLRVYYLISTIGVLKLMSISDEGVNDQSVKEKINELRTKYPVFTAVLERIPIMDLNEVVSVMVLVDPVRSVLKTHATRLTFIGENKELDQMIEDGIKELRTKHAVLAGILERIHKMDLRETAVGLLGIDAIESLLKLRALVILAS